MHTSISFIQVIERGSDLGARVCVRMLTCASARVCVRLLTCASARVCVCMRSCVCAYLSGVKFRCVHLGGSGLNDAKLSLSS